jgi:sigma-B regulation protein RsbU (phosphoserine phosphatase)
MKNARTAAGIYARLIVCFLALCCVSEQSLVAQSPTAPTAAPSTAAANNAAPANNTVAASLHRVMEVDGPWRFQVGDDPRWADPGFDDSAWPTVSLSKPLTEQGFDTYTGYGWYRLRLQPQQLAQLTGDSGSSQIDLLITGDGIAQFDVYAGGILSGRTKGMSDSPSMYQSPPLIAHLSQPVADGSVVLAIRTWAGPRMTIGRGLLDKVELGRQDDIAERLSASIDRRWDERLLAGIGVSFLFLCVAMLGATLYLAQRNHAEYLWLALLCLTVVFMGASETAYALALLPYSVFYVMNLWASRLFMAATLEFTLRFTGSEYKKIARVLQIFVLVLPILALVHLQQIFEYLSVTAEIAFSALVTVLLFRAWRKGRPDAGVMLAPFFLASTADSLDTVLDYAVSKHWIAERFAIHNFRIGPIEFPLSIVSYSVFLASLLAVIFYRFIHVSQEEQRSAAEIEAARSVQAMLIPTKLPSNHNFMLESAYLPVNGVGGDFFQVLPLKDDSMLIVVGDVSGKGLQAAMNASTLVGALRNELSHDPATILNNLNHVLVGATPLPSTGTSVKTVISFATCLCARVYPDGKIMISNAGHLSPYRDGREMELAADLPLGVIPDMQYQQATFQLNVGDRLIFLSDGVVEASNAQGELFGFERTQQVSNESARYIAQTAKRFGQTDDITVVSMYFAARTVQKATLVETIQG